MCTIHSCVCESVWLAGEVASPFQNMSAEQWRTVSHSSAGVTERRSSLGASYPSASCTVSRVIPPTAHRHRANERTRLHRSCSEGDFGLLSSWLQFICWPNNAVIDSRITIRRTLCPSTTTQDTTQFKILFCSLLDDADWIGCA